MMGICSPANVRTPPRAHAACRQVQELPSPLNDTPALILPRLKHLELVAVCLSKGYMERLLCGYTALEYLRLQAINGLSTFHITSMTLRTIYVCYWCDRNITKGGPRYGHPGHTCTWEITCSWSRRSNKNQCHFYAEIDSGGLLVWQILRTCYWIHIRSGTIAAFYLSFYKLTLFLILKMFVRLSFRKWFRQAWPRNCAQWRSWH